ncbi:4-(cytidine 5'-diphospho)-2-C-methyl-D-erythritol kinase [Oscillospiraceae bacterium WX1]
MTVVEKAYAKINLSIDIVCKTTSGYHDMRMVMQSTELYDGVTIMCTPGDGIFIKTDLKYLPVDERNIATRAARVFYNETGITGYRTEIAIEKRIPVGAGLGGGSSDGAAVLRGLNRLFQTGLRQEALERLGASFGSDVPFCVAGGTALAEGRGERLTALPPLPDCAIVICKPPFAISTPELFSKIVCDKIRLRPDTEGLVEALKSQSLTGVARRMYNVFEDVLPKGTGAVGEIKDRLLNYNALGAMMTGTGSAVFAVFEKIEQAETAALDLKKRFPETFLTRPSEKIIL